MWASTRLGDFAVQAIVEGETGAMAGEVHGELILTRFQDTYANHKPVPKELLTLLKTLAN